MLFFIAYTTIQ